MRARFRTFSSNSRVMNSVCFGKQPSDTVGWELSNVRKLSKGKSLLCRYPGRAGGRYSWQLPLGYARLPVRGRTVQTEPGAIFNSGGTELLCTARPGNTSAVPEVRTADVDASPPGLL